MTRPLFLLVLALLPAASASSTAGPAAGLVLVEGGTFQDTRSRHHGTTVTVADFYIGRHEVTQREWTELMGSNPSAFQGDTLPVEMVSWYECIEYCNRLSLREGLEPYYLIDKDNTDPANLCEVDDVKWTVTIREGANGYRLPTETEWEYAAGGGRLSRSHRYSGSDDVAKVAWYWQNSGDTFLQGLWNWPAVERNNSRTHPVGTKEPNELGLHDMSGNVREWCWDWHSTSAMEAPDLRGPRAGFARVWMGGGWMGGEHCCEPGFRGEFEPNSRGYDQGFRVCRDRQPRTAPAATTPPHP